MTRRRRIALEAEILPGIEGGIESVLIGLVSALGQLTDDELEYRLVVNGQDPKWLQPYIGPNQALISSPQPPVAATESAKRLLGPVRAPVGKILRRARGIMRPAPPPLPPSVPVSDGFYEQLGVELVHITYPLYYRRFSVPTLFSIYDLQHRHYPDFFSGSHLEWRETVYPAAFAESRVVITISKWVRDDVVRQYGIAARKIYAVPLAPHLRLLPRLDNAETDQVLAPFKLPRAFILYPALAYPHKNHLGLLDALAVLRAKHGQVVHLVLTGRMGNALPKIRRRIEQHSLQNQVHILGFVELQQLKALYGRARLMVFPSLFEGAGLPVLEALSEGLPVVCSDLPALREYAGDAALYFDPTSPAAIAEAIHRGLNNVNLDEMSARGKTQSAQFTWERTARTYRALYRQTLGHALTSPEQELLAQAQA